MLEDRSRFSNAYSGFNEISYCLDEDAVLSGTYLLENDTLILNYSGSIVTEFYKVVSEQDLSIAKYDTQHSKVEPFTHVYTIQKCGDKILLRCVENDRLAIQSDQ